MRLRLAQLAMGAGLLLGCERRPAPRPVDPVALERARVQLTMEEHCGTCHRSDQPGVPAALAVFDLTLSDWAAGLTPARRESALGRLRDKVSAEDLARVRRFLEAAAAPAPADCSSARSS
jgi:mono/diheme cytochrome c family protein